MPARSGCGRSPLGLIVARVRDGGPHLALAGLLWVWGWAGDTVGVLAEGRKPLPVAHATRQVEGWQVRVDERLCRGPQAALGARALKLLEARLVAIAEVVPEESLTKLRTITIQLDFTHGDLVPMQYHPDAGWLTAHGYSAQLAKCVHIPDVADFLEPKGIRQQPWVVLHELAHGFHDQVIGFEEPRVRAAWERFRASGKYQSVLTVTGERHAHYGLTDPQEFFAELSEAYFGSNDFYPFVAGELQHAEPEIFRLLGELWGDLPGATRAESR
ncbi:MAG: metallopeptidase [Planctomycetaceae bacterium]